MEPPAHGLALRLEHLWRASRLLAAQASGAHGALATSVSRNLVECLRDLAASHGVPLPVHVAQLACVRCGAPTTAGTGARHRVRPRTRRSPASRRLQRGAPASASGADGAADGEAPSSGPHARNQLVMTCAACGHVRQLGGAPTARPHEDSHQPPPPPAAPKRARPEARASAPPPTAPAFLRLPPTKKPAAAAKPSQRKMSHVHARPQAASASAPAGARRASVPAPPPPERPATEEQQRKRGGGLLLHSKPRKRGKGPAAEAPTPGASLSSLQRFLADL